MNEMDATGLRAGMWRAYPDVEEMAGQVQATVKAILEKRGQAGWRRGLVDAIVADAQRCYTGDLDNQLLFALGCGGVLASETHTLVNRNDLMRALGTSKVVDRNRLYLLAVFLTFTKGGGA